MRNKTLRQRVLNLEDQAWKGNYDERLKAAETFMRAVRDGKLLIIPHPRFESLEEALGLHYKINKSGKYVRRQKTHKDTVRKTD